MTSLYLECIDPARNRRAFYRLVATSDLFSYTLVRQWGRIGTRGCRRVDRFYDAMEMNRCAGRILKMRQRHGYRIVQAKGRSHNIDKMDRDEGTPPGQ